MPHQLFQRFDLSWLHAELGMMHHGDALRLLLLEHVLSTLFQTTDIRLFQNQGVCRRQFQTGRKWQKVLQMVRNHCGKRRNCSLRAISPIPTVFKRLVLGRHVRTRACLVYHIRLEVTIDLVDILKS